MGNQGFESSGPRLIVKTPGFWSPHGAHRAIFRSASREGRIENSPAIHRWVVASRYAESRRDGRARSSSVPTGLDGLAGQYPAMNRWAIFGRPHGR